MPGRGRPALAQADGRAAKQFDSACKRIALQAGTRVPMWRQLAEQLEGVIRGGRLTPGARIPSEEALAQRFGVSRPVIRNALHALAVNGMVVKLPRKGIFVAEPRPETAFVTTNLAAYDDLIARGHKVKAVDFEQYRSVPSGRERTLLGLDASDTVVRIGRVFWMDGEPIAHARVSFHGAKVPGLEDADLDNKPILRHLERHYGRRLARAERWLKAATAPKEVATKMQVSARAPLLWIESVAFESDNTPLEYYEAYYNSELALLHLSVLG